MEKEIRFGDFVREASIKQQSISYNNLTPKPQFDADGKEIPYKPQKLHLRGIDIHRLLAPYVSVRLYSQIKAVTPLAIYLVLFQMLILKQTVLDHWIITGGLIAVIIGLMIFMEGLKLYRRIDVRIDRMVGFGLVDEVKKLVNMGYVFSLPSMSSIGYKQVGQYLMGEITLEAAVERIKFDSHRLVRHQYNWFRLSDKRIRWFDVQEEIESEIRELVARFANK